MRGGSERRRTAPTHGGRRTGCALSGELVRDLLVGTPNAAGVDVVDLGLSTTPTVELAVPAEQADGGVILTASHNPRQWNALKLLDATGEFERCSGRAGLGIGQRSCGVCRRGCHRRRHPTIRLDGKTRRHLSLALVNADAVRAAVQSSRGFRQLKWWNHCANAVGSPRVRSGESALRSDGPVCPQPRAASRAFERPLRCGEGGCDLGISVDPDVDRLAFVEDGSWLGGVYVGSRRRLRSEQTPGNTGQHEFNACAAPSDRSTWGYTASAVGEVNVVRPSKTPVVIGGEGNGGIIYPASHCGRDAVVGTALFLTQLAESGQPVSAQYVPDWFMSKDKLALPAVDVDQALRQLMAAHPKPK